MKTITTLLAIAALSTTLGLAGCKKKDSTAADPNAKPAEMKKDEAKKDEAKPADPAAKPADPAAKPAGDLPAECNDYKAAIEKLASCDKLPQATRDQMKSAFDTASASWGGMPAEAKASLKDACKAGADAVTNAAKATCGW
jgi:hypothetical protein